MRQGLWTPVSCRGIFLAKMRDILIINGCVITGAGAVFEDGFVHVSDGRIKTVGDMANASISGIKKIDAGGRYVLPGFINPHMHFYGLMARGMPMGRMRTFGQVLKELWWKLDRALTLEDVYVSALLCGIEAIRSGVTTIFDHHASYGAVAGSLDEISKAIDEIGLRASLCYEISDREGKRMKDEAVAESARFLDEMRDRSRRDHLAMQRAMVGLHASMTLSDGTLDAARELMDIYGVGAHVHVAEGKEDVEATMRLNGMSPIERLAKTSILRPGTLAVHCVHLSKNDVNRLRESKATVVHNPLSNLNNAVGIAPMLELVGQRVPVAVGTDGMSAGISGDVRLAAVLHKIGAKDAQAGGDEIMRAVWDVAPRIATEMFGVKIGSIKEGASADVIIVEARPPTEVTEQNAWWHTLFGVFSSAVRTTIVAGAMRMQDFKILGIDEASTTTEARKLSKALWKRLS